jgi:hypothetical protein
MFEGRRFLNMTERQKTGLADALFDLGMAAIGAAVAAREFRATVALLFPPQSRPKTLRERALDRASGLLRAIRAEIAAMDAILYGSAPL